MEERIKVCSYSRVSTDKEEQRKSLENQRLDFDDYFKNNPKYEYIETYYDEGLSGTSLKKREDFKRMLVDCGLEIKNVDNSLKTKTKIAVIASHKEPLYKYIFVSNTSRFGRNIVQVIDIIRELKSVGVYVIFKDRNLSTENEKDMSILPYMFYFDEMESSDKSSKVKKGHEKSANTSDKIHTNSRIYGYRYDKENNRLIRNNEEEKNVVKIFEMYSENLGIRRISNYLSGNGIKTRLGKNFGKSSINAMLRNDKYAGFNTRLKYDTGEVLINKHYPKIKPTEEWKVIGKSDRIEPIISKELFDKCQEIRKGKIRTDKQIGIYHSPSKYAGVITCECCGSNYTRNIDRGRYFYNCGMKKTKGTSACNNVNINSDEIERILEDYATNNHGQIIDSIKTKSMKKLENIKQVMVNGFDVNQDKEVNLLKQRLASLGKEEELLYDTHSRGKISEKLYSKKWDEIQRNIDETNKNIYVLSKDNNEKLNDIQIIDEEIQYILGVKVRAKYTKDDILEVINSIGIRPYPFKGKYYSDKHLTEFYHILRNGKIVGLVDISIKLDEKITNIMIKRKNIAVI